MVEPPHLKRNLKVPLHQPQRFLVQARRPFSPPPNYRPHFLRKRATASGATRKRNAPATTASTRVSRSVSACI